MANSLDDVQLANRVNEWPHPQQPFWFVNRQQIKDHIARPVPCQGAGCPPAAPAHQSPFITSAQRMRRRR
ncbi:hypothetical protein ONE63_004275 [Megalurothrips usitatus]|uniref:Uncharacterized protein n=1 Tax=Megalurothrips usitatus TaxID=439358 RepID=A0AAV7X354_9NEOP|nr:hypothetical protein ONE63_004275 [Megalurothrips usitatus]